MVVVVLEEEASFHDDACLAAFVLAGDEEPASEAALIDVLEEASPAVLVVDEEGECPDYFLQVLPLTSLSSGKDKLHLVWMNTRNTSCCPSSLWSDVTGINSQVNG